MIFSKPKGSYPLRHAAFSVIILLSSCFFWNCEEEKTEEDIVESRRAALLDHAVKDIFTHTYESIAIAEDSLAGEELSYGLIDFTNDAQLSIHRFDTTTWPKDLTINYPQLVISGYDERSRIGNIKVRTSGYWSDSALTVSISFDNYFWNGYQLHGEAHINSVDSTSLAMPVYELITNDLKLSQAGDTLISARLHHHIIREDGQTTEFPLITDDKFIINGSGQYEAGKFTFSSEIVQDIRFDFDCAWLQRGAIDINIPEKDLHTLNYGRGACDDQASVIVLDKEVKFTLE